MRRGGEVSVRVRESAASGKIKRISPNARVFHPPPEASPHSGKNEIVY
jgi:hypothetical protein